jgi:endonuclease/exonuclease/phosphatase family metal-dependent hydrolase
MILNNKLFTLILFCSILILGACGSDSTPTPIVPDEPEPNTEFDPVGTTSTLDFGTWNLEWFGDTGNGPTNEDLQLNNASFIISGLDMDIWSVQEVTSTSHFNELIDSLEGYDGILANDPVVQSDSAYYEDFGGNEQKLGLIYKTDIITVNSAQVILTDYDYEFAGRPPVEIQLTANVDDQSADIVAILIHAKCCTDDESYNRKEAGANALKSYLDTTWPDANVIVFGDFNDDVDTSISSGRESVYKTFVDDAQNYTFPTMTLSENNISSTTGYPDVIDHHLNSNELYAFYVSESVMSFQPEDYVSNYASTTSDHYPVLTRYTLNQN